MMEKPVAKAEVFFIFEAKKGVVKFLDKPWVKGDTYITNLNLWFVKDGDRKRIPIKSIDILNRKPVGFEKLGDNLLGIDYMRADEACTSLIAAPDRVLNALKNTIAPLLTGVPKAQQNTNAIDKKLLMMINMGMKDLKKAKFLLGVDDAGLKDSLTRMFKAGLIDNKGNLSDKGKKLIKTFKR